jgi:hypothetical protein
MIAQPPARFPPINQSRLSTIVCIVTPDLHVLFVCCSSNWLLVLAWLMESGFPPEQMEVIIDPN